MRTHWGHAKCPSACLPVLVSGHAKPWKNRKADCIAYIRLMNLMNQNHPDLCELPAFLGANHVTLDFSSSRMHNLKTVSRHRNLGHICIQVFSTDLCSHIPCSKLNVAIPEQSAEEAHCTSLGPTNQCAPSYIHAHISCM